MSKVEQGAPHHRDTKEIVKFARELGANFADSDWHIFEQFVDAAVRHAAASLPESQPTNSVMSRRCSGDMGKEESQPAPEMDYEKAAELLVKMARYVAIKSAEKMVSEWLRAHDARVQPSSVAGTDQGGDV